VLVGLEADVEKTLHSIQNGISLLDARRADLISDDADDGAARPTEDGLAMEPGEPVDLAR